MDIERFRRVRQLFEAVLERDPDERSAFLEQACQGDKTVLFEVRQLLAAHYQSRATMDLPTRPELGDLSTETRSSQLFAGTATLTHGRAKTLALLATGIVCVLVFCIFAATKLAPWDGKAWPGLNFSSVRRLLAK